MHAVDSSAAEARALEAARRGDVAGFNQLVLAYQTVVYSVALRMLGNTDDAADATQETFVSAFRAIRDFRGGSFKAWLLRIAANACYDILRRRQRRPASSLDALIDEAGLDVGEPDEDRGPEGTALSSETARAIQAGLATLPEDQRMLVLLCDVQGLSYEEAADATGAALGTVKSRLSRARARLRDYLGERGELPSDSGRHH
ncbi:MAG: sigma-70 family RNA polymerase sigma factor [Chloroflexi bacterium]|nr:sigma-70 family RNA polymerase sigma factor [Chloroflexota bacterium]